MGSMSVDLIRDSVRAQGKLSRFVNCIVRAIRSRSAPFTFRIYFKHAESSIVYGLVQLSINCRPTGNHFEIK